jgi:hypothetical protein
MAWTRYNDTKAISTDATTALTTASGSGNELPLGNNVFQANVSGTGAMTVVVEVSNDAVDWFTAITFTMDNAGAGTALKDSGVIVNSWRYAQYVSTIGGGSPVVTVTLSGG